MIGLTQFVCSFMIIFGVAKGFEFFDSESTSVNLDIVTFENQSYLSPNLPNPTIHPISKRNAYEELRDLSNILGRSAGSSSGSPLSVNRRLYNSSVAITVPLFSFKFPHINDGGFLVNQALYGVFSIAIILITFGISFIFTGSAPTVDGSRRSLKSLESVKNSHFNFMGSDVSHSMGMDGLQCLQKIICQAYRSPENKRYGLLGSTIRFGFPAPANGTLELGDDHSAFEIAAGKGKYSKENCEQLYDCLIDAMGSARYLAHWYGHHHNAKYLLRMIDYNSS